jgi:hypothetical protein
VEATLFQHRIQHSWIDDFVLRGNGAGESLAPFSQTFAAAELLARVADERSGLPRQAYEQVGVAGRQIEMLADVAQRLETDFNGCVRASDSVRAGGGDASDRARVLMRSLTGAVEATATLMEVCQALLDVAATLTVITRPKARIQIVAAVEGLRCATSVALVTVHSSLGRITDARVYDRLVKKVESAQSTLDYADRIARDLRILTRPSQLMRTPPPQEPRVSIWTADLS